MKESLLVNFYTEISSTFSKENPHDYKCFIRLNPEHPVYKGHFMQLPVVPGVCLIQIIKEVLADKFQKKLMMTEGDNIKFLALINPFETSDLEISFSVRISENSLEANVVYSHNNVSCVKFKGKFITGE
jgi:3-hydroxyacyl-[acyl-carrier-protein] dehydratase